MQSPPTYSPRLTCTALTCVYASSPASPSSRPIPLCFTPPNGTLSNRQLTTISPQSGGSVGPTYLKSQSLLLFTHTVPL